MGGWGGVDQMGGGDGVKCGVVGLGCCGVASGGQVGVGVRQHGFGGVGWS